MQSAISILLAALLCVAVPFVVVNRLFPSLAKHAPKQANYHGVEVLNGLGIVWFVWLAFVWMGFVGYDALRVGQPEWIRLVMPAFPLLAGTCALGLFDDWAGDRSSRGFRGHFAALRHGEITTGMLKMAGIGLLSLFTAIAMQDFSEPVGLCVARIVCATAVMALFANLMNLFDLRPLRATKVYIVCLALAVAALALTGRFTLGWAGTVGMALACVGPIAATWKLDGHEVAMLGDAGANTMGALLGFLFSLTLPIWLLAPLAIALLALNLLSERFSFTKVIASVPVLRRLDELFRPKELIERDKG